MDDLDIEECKDLCITLTNCESFDDATNGTGCKPNSEGGTLTETSNWNNYLRMMDWDYSNVVDECNELDGVLTGDTCVLSTTGTLLMTGFTYME